MKINFPAAVTIRKTGKEGQTFLKNRQQRTAEKSIPNVYSSIDDHFRGRLPLGYPGLKVAMDDAISFFLVDWW